MKRIMLKVLFFLIVLASSSEFLHCAPTYSPAARGLLYGSPARFEKGDLEIGGGAGGTAPLGGKISYAPTDFLQVETGVSNAGGVMGYVGPRFSFWPVTRQSHHVKLLAEAEFGFGLGAGGEYCGNDPERETCDGPGDSTWPLLDPQKAEKSWKNRFAYGGYAGLGLGVGVLEDWLDFFAKVRIQETKADGIPATFWFSTGVGVQVNIYKVVKIYFFPYVHHQYLNRLDAESFNGLELGLAVNYNVLQ